MRIERLVQHRGGQVHLVRHDDRATQEAVKLLHGFLLVPGWDEYGDHLAAFGDFQAVNLSGANLVEKIKALRFEFRCADGLRVQGACSRLRNSRNGAFQGMLKLARHTSPCCAFPTSCTSE
jgi:hypothetical protein